MDKGTQPLILEETFDCALWMTNQLLLYKLWKILFFKLVIFCNTYI